MAWLQGLDSGLLFLIREHLATPLLDSILLFCTTLGNKGAIWLLLGVGLLFSKKHRKAGFAVLLALVFCFFVGNLGLKPLLARARPCWLYFDVPLLLPVPQDFSFPSGHTMASFAAACALLLLDRRLGIPALVLAAVIGFSRLYLFVHFPTDVLAGALLGLLFGAAAVRVVKWAQAKRPA